MPRSGHVIAPLTIRDVLEVYELRLDVEPPAVRRAASVISDEVLARLRGLAEPEIETGTGPGLDRFMQTNRAIHVTLSEQGGNRRTGQLVARLLDDSERARRVALRAGAASGGTRARSELLDVLQALESRDADQAAELMAAAIDRFRGELVAALQNATLDVPIQARTP